MHLKYSCLVDGSHTLAELGFEASYSLKETVLVCAAEEVRR